MQSEHWKLTWQTPSVLAEWLKPPPSLLLPLHVSLLYTDSLPPYALPGGGAGRGRTRTAVPGAAVARRRPVAACEWLKGATSPPRDERRKGENESTVG